MFALYVANFANYANTYGALGGVIVIMLWLYLSALVLVAAAALVAAALKELQPSTVAAIHRVAGAEAAASDQAKDVAGASRVENRHLRMAEARREPASAPGDWAIAGLAVAVGVALGTAVARVVGSERR